jgi:hypothetical protein
MDDLWVVVVIGSDTDDTKLHSPKLYINDYTEDELIEQYNEMLKEKMRGEDEGISES